MKLDEMVKELERQKPLKWDRKVHSSIMEMVAVDNDVRFRINGGDPHTVTKPCHSQIAERLDIPAKYYHRMAAEAPNLMAENVNTWLERTGKDLFVRRLDDSVRAVLSDRYRVIDHLDFLYCALNELQSHEAEIEDCYLSETEMHIKIKSLKLRDFIRHKDDVMIGGLLFTNSETGHKALRVEPRLYRVQCTNGMVMEQFTTRQIHLGNGNGNGNGNGETDEMVYLSIRRSIRELFGRFGEIVQALRDNTEIKVRNVQAVINNLVEHYGLNESQKANILMAFGAEPDLDKYGIANAVTKAAQMEESWETGLELEKIGGRIITLSPDEFRVMDN
jgi:hypothetical protein